MSVEVAPGSTVAVAVVIAGQVLPNLSQWPAARTALWYGHLLRMSRDDQWKTALPKLPDSVRTRHGSEDRWVAARDIDSTSS